MLNHQPSRCCPTATARRCPGTCARERSSPALPGTLLPTVPGRGPTWVHTAPCGRDRSNAGKSAVPGHPARLWPSSPQLAGRVNSGAHCCRSRGAPGLAQKRVQTEVPSGLAASSADGSRRRHPETPCRCPAHPWQASGLSGAPAPATRPPYECRSPAGLTECDDIGIGTPAACPVHTRKV
jgi:hypothetical protein